jgi:hypothetical protein
MDTLKVELSPEEVGYVLGRLKEPLEYYRLLAGNAKFSAKNRAQLKFLEGLLVKLVR